MRTGMMAAAGVVMAASVVGIGVPARAQLLDTLKGAAGMGSSSSGGSGLGALGGSMPSVGSASSGNIAGVLRYCVRNNYLGGNGPASVENQLSGKLGSGGTTGNPQFASGAQGVLQPGNGQDVSLGGGGLKGKLTQKLCKLVLQHARSLI